MQVMGIDSDQLLLARVIEDGVGPDLNVRYSVTEFVKGELSGFLLDKPSLFWLYLWLFWLG